MAAPEKIHSAVVSKEIYLNPNADLNFNGTKGFVPVSFSSPGAGSKSDQSFFIATRKYEIIRISEVHSVAESTAGTLNVQVTKDEGTEAPGAGDNLLTDNSDAGFDLKGTANTVQAGSLVTDKHIKTLDVGDRLSVDFTAAGAEIAGVTITVDLKPV